MSEISFLILVLSVVAVFFAGLLGYRNGYAS